MDILPVWRSVSLNTAWFLKAVKRFCTTGTRLCDIQNDIRQCCFSSLLSKLKSLVFSTHFYAFLLYLCCPLPSNISSVLIRSYRLNVELVLICLLQWIGDSTPWQTVWAVLLIICGTLCTLHHHSLWTKYVSCLPLVFVVMLLVLFFNVMLHALALKSSCFM